MEIFMVKLVGSLLLAMTGIVLAVSIYRFEQKKLRITDAFISLILHIKGQIDCFCMPLCDILKTIPKELDIPCPEGEQENFGAMIESSKIYLDGETYRLLWSFYSEFGSMYREEQLKRCDYYIQALGEQRKLLFDDLPARAKIGSALCICSVIGILILLW